jgi:hypothetical protein
MQVFYRFDGSVHHGKLFVRSDRADGEIPGELQADEMTEERKFAILFAATILAARTLIDMDPDKPHIAKQFFVDRIIDEAAFILERIDARWPQMEYFCDQGLRTSRMPHAAAIGLA